MHVGISDFGFIAENLRPLKLVLHLPNKVLC